MAWRGCNPAIKLGSVAEFGQYLRSLSSGWRPSGIALHNTASPTLDQWWHGGTSPEQRMKNLRSYYENDMGWSAGPHAFVDGKSIWIFTPFNVKGVHSPSWNGTRLGIEMVGDYNKESDEVGMGAEVMKLTVGLFAECCEYYGWPCDGNIIKLHKEDPATDHDCPGRNVVKNEFLTDVQEYMNTGGEDQTEPEVHTPGTIAGLDEGDTLNIRAAATASAPVIGTAENDDRVLVVGRAWNGTTEWLRIQIGEAEGPAIAVFGWVSARYVELDESVDRPWRENITATVFGHGADAQEGAYNNYIDGSTVGVSFPYKWRNGPRPPVIVQGPLGWVQTTIVDVGPWNINDPNYVLSGAPPLVLQQYAQQQPAQNNKVPVNDAAIDLTKPVADAIGITGKGKVRWRFA